MTQAQLNSFQQKLSSYSKVEHIVAAGDNKAEYLLVWWLDSKLKKYRLDYVFVIYNNTLLRRYEIDGYLRSYVLNALEKALSE